MSPRSRQIGCLAMIAVSVGFVVWIASEIIPRSRYGYTAQRIAEKLRSLRDRRPEGVDAVQWEFCVDWAVTAHCNICFSEEHTSFVEMRRFESGLDEKLNGAVGPDTVKWIFDRLERTGPTGKHYIDKFQEQWRDALHAIIK